MIAGLLPVATFAETTKDIYEACAEVTSSTVLPSSFDYELGSETRYMQGSGGYSNEFYAKILKVEIQSGTLLRIDFDGKDSEIDTKIRIFKATDSGVVDYDTFDNDNLNGHGESAAVLISETGTYYLVLGGYGSSTGICHAEITSVAAVVKELPAEFENLTESITSSTSFEYDLGADNVVYTSDYFSSRFAKLAKLELSEESFVSFTCATATDENKLDMRISVYMEDGDDIVYLGEYDSDNFKGYGEKTITTHFPAGTYYLAFTSYGIGLVDGTVTVTDYDADVVLTSYLDFTGSSVPTPGEGDLWSWNAETKTLTLEDGFILYCTTNNTPIVLPSGSTVYVKGTATIIADSDSDAIYCDDDITISGVDAATSVLNVECGDDGVDCESLAISGITMDIFANDNGLFVYDGELSVQNSVISIMSENESIYGEIELTAENSKFNLRSEEEGIQVNGDGTITFTDCDVHIDTLFGYEGISTDEEGSVTVSGGRLVIKADDTLIATDALNLENVFVDFDTTYNLLNIFTPEDFAGIPGTLRMYDEDGELVYEGEWKAEFLSSGGYGVYVDETEIYRIVSVCNHEWDPDWSKDETHHWHECTNEYCNVTENSEKNGYGEHDPKLVNGEWVCGVCGAKVAAPIEVPPPTADGVEIAVFATAATVSLAAVALFIAKKRCK